MGCHETRDRGPLLAFYSGFFTSVPTILLSLLPLSERGPAKNSSVLTLNVKIGSDMIGTEDK